MQKIHFIIRDLQYYIKQINYKKIANRNTNHKYQLYKWTIRLITIYNIKGKLLFSP